MSSDATLYDLLRVPPDASLARIQTAYRERMAEIDLPGFVPPGDVGLARRRLELAFATLSNTTLRAAYDERLERLAQSRAEARAERSRAGTRRPEVLTPGTAEPLRRRWMLAGVIVLGVAAVALGGLYVRGSREATRADPQHDLQVLRSAEERLVLQAFYQQTGKRAASRDEMELLRRQLNDEKARDQARARAEQAARTAEQAIRNGNRAQPRPDWSAEEQQRRAEARAREAFMRDKEEEDAFRRRAAR